MILYKKISILHIPNHSLRILSSILIYSSLKIILFTILYRNNNNILRTCYISTPIKILLLLFHSLSLQVGHISFTWVQSLIQASWKTCFPLQLSWIAKSLFLISSIHIAHSLTWLLHFTLFPSFLCFLNHKLLYVYYVI